MTAKKEQPAKRGRKAAPPDSKTEPFTIRLTPKLRYGIELLGRSQRGRTLSQVVEWAIQRGLNSVSVHTSSTLTLGEVLDEVWPLPSDWQRLQRLYDLSSDLLDFSEKAICETIVRSVEFVRLTDNVREMSRKAKPDWKALESGQSPPPSKADVLSKRTFDALDFFVEANWDKLRDAIAQRDLSGKPREGSYLMEILGQSHTVENVHDLEAFLEREHQWRRLSSRVKR